MVFKYRRVYNYNKIIISILIFFMLLVLYLGNYNLVEGNSVSKTEAMAYLADNKKRGEALESNTMHSSETNTCNIDELEEQQQEAVMSNNGAKEPTSEPITRSAQLKATLCSKNGLIK